MNTTSFLNIAPLALGMLLGGATAHADSDISAANDERTFVVGGEFDRPPYQFLNDKGEAAGLDVDLMKAVARSAGLEARFQKDGPGNEFAADVKLEAAFITDVVRESEREVWQYSAPHSAREHGIFVREDSLYRGIKDLEGRDIVVLNASHAREWLSRHGFRNHLVGADSLESGLALLSTGNYEALVCDRYEGLHAIASSGIDKVRVLKEGIIPVETGFAILRQDEALAKSLESGMTVVKNTGEFEKLQSGWLEQLELEDKSLKLGAAYSYALWVIIPALIFLGSACVSFFTVRKKTMMRIRELEIELAREKELNEDLQAAHAKQRYVINQLSAVSLVEQLSGVSGDSIPN